MTKRELLVKERFQDNIQDAINSIKDNKGFYKQHIDAMDHSIRIDFEIIPGYILAIYNSDYDTDSAFTIVRFVNKKWWVKIKGTLEDAMIELVAKIQKETKYNPMGITSEDE